jgi:protein-disulfide isomerase
VSERRRPRPVGLAVLGLIALVLGASVVGIALQKPDDDTIEITGASEVQSLLGGIPQEGAALGADSAPVTVEVFNDLQCPDCADYHLEVITPLIEGPVRDRDVKLVFRHFSLSPRLTTLSSFAAVAAGDQGRQWQYIQLFFINQDEARARGVSDELLERIAAAVLGLELQPWNDELTGGAVRERVEADAALAAERRLPAEPAVVVTGPRRTVELDESPSLEEIEAAIEAAGG